MHYKMYDRRERGDSGTMSMALWPNPDKNASEKILSEQNARPRVGVAMRVGSIIVRSYLSQDWWQTTLIKEIIEDTPNKVVFKTTSGSEYTWE